MSDAPQLPSTIHWSQLSPRGLEIAKQVAMRISAGYSYDEIAEQIEADRPNIRNLELPPPPIRRELVTKLVKSLRDEIQATGAAEF